MARKTAAEKKALEAAKNKQVATVDDVPAHLKAHMGSDAGSEEVGTDDLVIPRLEVVQALSKCRDKADPGYIADIEEGDLYNTVTREAYGPDVQVIPLYFKTEYVVQQDMDAGDGFAGRFETELEAARRKKEQEHPDEWEVVDTAVHFVLIVHEDGELEQAAIYMAKSKLRASRAWNSLIRLNKGPRFSRVYTMSSQPTRNAKNQSFHTVSFATAGYVDEDQFEASQEQYDLIKSSRVRVAGDEDAPGQSQEEERAF